MRKFWTLLLVGLLAFPVVTFGEGQKNTISTKIDFGGSYMPDGPDGGSGHSDGFKFSDNEIILNGRAYHFRDYGLFGVQNKGWGLRLENNRDVYLVMGPKESPVHIGTGEFPVDPKDFARIDLKVDDGIQIDVKVTGHGIPTLEVGQMYSYITVILVRSRFERADIRLPDGRVVVLYQKVKEWLDSDGKWTRFGGIDEPLYPGDVYWSPKVISPSKVRSTKDALQGLRK